MTSSNMIDLQIQRIGKITSLPSVLFYSAIQRSFFVPLIITKVSQKRKKENSVLNLIYLSRRASAAVAIGFRAWKRISRYGFRGISNVTTYKSQQSTRSSHKWSNMCRNSFLCMSCYPRSLDRMSHRYWDPPSSCCRRRSRSSPHHNELECCRLMVPECQREEEVGRKMSYSNPTSNSISPMRNLHKASRGEKDRRCRPG